MLHYVTGELMMWLFVASWYLNMMKILQSCKMIIVNKLKQLCSYNVNNWLAFHFWCHVIIIWMFTTQSEFKVEDHSVLLIIKSNEGMICYQYDLLIVSHVYWLKSNETYPYNQQVDPKKSHETQIMIHHEMHNNEISYSFATNYYNSNHCTHFLCNKINNH